MLGFIKEKLSERMPGVIAHKIDDPVPNELVMECAHLFQELDDLTVEGQDEIDAAGSDTNRPIASALDIPLEDDIEIGNIELNLLDGRTTDTPGDTAVPTVNEYATNIGVKTEEDFYEEACTMVRAFPRDTAESLEERRREYARKAMEDYQEQCVQEGVFGHDKYDVSDASVPSFATVNFGSLKGPGSPDYYVKLPIKYQTDKHRKILKKQLEAVSIINDIEAFKDIKKTIHEFAQKDSDYKLESPNELWEHATPTELRVPSGPADKYVVYVVIDADWADKELVFSCTISMKGSGKKSADIKHITAGDSKSFKTKKEIVKESADVLEIRRTMNMPGRFDNEFNSDSFFQEAIDLGADGGDTDLPPESGSSSEDVSVGGDIDASANDTSTTDTTTNDAGTTDSGDGAVEVPVKTNDVSDQIAEKVASEDQDLTSDDSINNDLENITDDDMNAEGAEDVTDDLSSDDPDFNLDTPEDTSMDGDDSGDVDLPGDDTSSIDSAQFDNMSIDDLMAQGSEKLKTLSIGQLKSFLSGENTDPVVEEAFQEAFFLTPRNINKEIYKELKRALGILNQSTASGSEILKTFKTHTRRLNRALVKAIKMEKVFNVEERKTISKLNKCLTDLNIVIGTTVDSNYAATIKRLIQAFVSQAEAVKRVIEAHDPSIAAADKKNVKGMTDVNATVKNNKMPKKEG